MRMIVLSQYISSSSKGLQGILNAFNSGYIALGLKVNADGETKVLEICVKSSEQLYSIN